MDNIDKNEELRKINKKLLESLENYRKTIAYIAGDAPISILCLPKATETILINAGCLRVYDLFNCDFTKIKGLGKIRIGDLTTRLDQFSPMS